MNYKSIPVSIDLYDPMYDDDTYQDKPKCNECGESLEVNKLDGDVCDPCYNEE